MGGQRKWVKPGAFAAPCRLGAQDPCRPPRVYKLGSGRCARTGMGTAGPLKG